MINTTELRKTYKKAFPQNIIPAVGKMLLELSAGGYIKFTTTNEGQIFLLTKKGINLYRENTAQC